MGRTKNSIINLSIGSVSQVVSLILSFVSRTFFINILGNEYLSVNGLFSNILTLLSFTELGIGSAIIYSLYKPLAENDYNKIGQLMNLFKKAYYYIAMTITLLGLSVIPFLQHIISDVPNIQEDLRLLYLLFLANTVFSYVWGYKKSLLTADQKQYILTVLHLVIIIMQTIIQILVLVYTGNFVLYLIVFIICTICNNILSTAYVNHKYPWLKHYDKNSLDKESRKPVFDNIKAILYYKIGSTVLNGTDNIIISTVLKTTLIGMCSNYLMIISAVQAIFRQGLGGLTASIGNYSVTASKKDKEIVFDQLNLLFYWVFGFVTVEMAILFNPFVYLWIGDSYVLSESIVLALSLSFFFTMNNSIPSSFRTAMGLFRQARFAPFCAAVFNVVVSIVLARIYGLLGVFLGTIITTIIFYSCVDIYFVSRELGASKRLHFSLFFIRATILLFVYFVIRQIIVLTDPRPTVISLIVSAVIVAIVFNVLFLVIYHRTTAFLGLINKIYTT